MGDIGNTIQVIFAILAMVAAGLSTLLLGSLKTLRDSNADLRQRDADRTIEVAELTAKVATLEADNAALGRQVRGDDRFEEFAKKLDDATAKVVAMIGALGRHNDNAAEHWMTEERKLDRLVVVLTEVRDEVRQQRGSA